MKTLKNTARAVAVSLIATLTVLAGVTQTAAATYELPTRVVENTSSFSGIERSYDYNGVGQSFMPLDRSFNFSNFSAVVDSVHSADDSVGPQVDVTLSVFEGDPRSGTLLLEQFYPSFQFPSHSRSPGALSDEHWVNFEFPAVFIKVGTQYSVTLSMGEFKSFRDESPYCKSIGPESEDFDEWWYDLICGEPAQEKEHVVWAMSEPRPQDPNNTDKTFLGGHAWTTFGGFWEGNFLDDGSFAPIVDATSGNSADYYDPSNSARWSSMIFRAQGLAPENGSENGPHPEPERILDIVAFAADKSGWSWVAAAQTIVGYRNKVTPDSQCDLVKAVSGSHWCTAGSGSLEDVAGVLTKHKVYRAPAVASGVMSFAQIKDDIDDGVPIIVQLENVTIDGSPADNEYAIIRGYDVRTEGIHFILMPEGPTAVGHHAFAGNSVPLETFANMTDPYELTGNGSLKMTWEWSGFIRGIKNPYSEPEPPVAPDPEPEPEPGVEENYDAGVIDEAIKDSTALYFMMTVATFRESGASFQCIDMDVTSLVNGNQEMNELLNRIWKLQALTSVVTYIGSPHFSVARTTPVGEVAGVLYPMWRDLFNNTVSNGNPLEFSLKPNMGFGIYLLSDLSTLAASLGVCPLYNIG